MLKSSNPLPQTRALQESVVTLRALLELQQEQIRAWENRLYSAGPAGQAARRLVTLKERASR